MGLVEFLLARLQGRQVLAQNAADGQRSFDSGGMTWAASSESNVYDAVDGGPIAVGPYGGGLGEASAAFIAANDPAYVLQDIAAKRRIIEHVRPVAEDDLEYSGWQDSAATVLKLLAAPFSSHPDWQPEWSTE